MTSQLESQIESLKRQSRQANRFKALSADIRRNEAILLHIRWMQAKEAEAEADSQLNQITSLTAEKAQAQMHAAKNQAVAALRLPELREEEAKAAAALQRLQIAGRQLEEDAGRILKRRDELQRRLAQLGEDIRREERFAADNIGSLERLEREETELADLLADAGDAAIEAQERLGAASETLIDSERRLATATAARAEAQALRNQMERRMRDLSDRRARLDRQLATERAELEALDEKRADMPDPEERREAVEAAEGAIETAEETLAAIEDALAAARSDEAAARPPVDRVRAEMNALETEARTISRMLEAVSGSGSATPVVDAIVVDRGLETALGAALGDGLEAPLDETAPAHWRMPGDAAADAPLPDGVTPLAAHVRGPAELARVLAQIGVVTDEAEAARLQPALAAGQVLVTRKGAVFRWDGHVAGADAPSAAALRLGQKNRLKELEAEIDEARARVETGERALAEAGARVRREDERLRACRDEMRLLQRRLTDAREALAAAERAAGDLMRRHAVAAEALSRTETQAEELAAEAEDAAAALADAPDLSDLDMQLRVLTAEVATDRAAVAEARAAYDGLARENEARRRRIAAIAIERETWKARAASAAEQVETLRAREAEAREELEELLDAPDAFEEQRHALMAELSKAEAARRQAADRLAEAETGVREADRLATLALSELAEVRERRGRAEERLLSNREKRIEAEARIRDTVQCAPHEIIRLTGLTPEAPLPDLRNIEREVDRLKMERERLGPVNLRAEEEQKELSDRLAALNTEREDIIEAIRKLRAAIQNLNREGRERLLAAFDVVNAQFQRLFTHLFNGGTAELQLIESEDPLEAGLEILARPPGKKPQTMTLLSGGEQALTAMALIFAVFLTNPAPICVLDEVDAPLDDHNVERYCNLMDEMAASTETRFVIITHNPITMARMNRLYGVTMAEQGVSQLVSVDLQTAERLREVV